MQDGDAELGRLDRILPAMADQRAADEHDRREPIDQTEFAHRVGDIDVGVGQGSSPRERTAAPSPATEAISAIPAPRSGCRGAMMVSRPGNVFFSRRCASMTRGFLAGMGGGRSDDGASDGRHPDQLELVVLGRRRRHVELEIAGGADARRAEPGVARGVIPAIAPGIDRSAAAAPRWCAENGASA